MEMELGLTTVMVSVADTGPAESLRSVDLGFRDDVVTFPTQENLEELLHAAFVIDDQNADHVGPSIGADARPLKSRAWEALPERSCPPPPGS